MSESIQPLGNRIVIRPARKKQTASGIVLPDAVTDKEPERGIVVAVGPGEQTPYGHFIKPSLVVGDEVVFQRYAGTRVGEGDEAVWVLAERDVLARVASAPPLS